MFEVLKKLMLAKEINFEEGKISLLGHPIIMCPVSTIVEIRKLLEKVNSTAIMYYAAKKSGNEYVKTIKNKFKMKPKDLILWGINTISLAGWGKSELIKYDPKNKIAIMTYDSTFAKLYGHSKEPIDEIFRGFASTTASACFGKEIEGVEIKCKAMGSNICELIFKEKNKFDLSDKFIRKQLFVENKKISKLLLRKEI